MPDPHGSRSEGLYCVMVRAKTSLKRVPKSPGRKLLAGVVRRVVEACQPESIVLFGSAARGEMTEHSDLDLLVIKGGSTTSIASTTRSR